MFFNTKRSPRKTTHQTLSTEQLEPKAMFNAAPLQAEIGFEDRLSNDYDGNDAVLQVRSSQNVTCNTGFSGGGNHICNADSIWTTGGASTLRLAGTAGPGGSTYLRSDNRFVFETPKDDSGISLHASANPHAGPEGFMKLGDIKGEFRQTLSLSGSAGPGGSTFMTGEDGRSIVHPSFNVGNDGRSIVHPQFNLGTNSGPGGTTFMTGEDGRVIVHPQFNIGGTSGPGGTTFMTGEDGRSIVHPQFNVGNNVLAQANQQPSLTAIRDVDIASESLGGSASPGGDDIFMPKPNRIAGSADPGGDDIFMPKPNRTDVWTNGSATSLAPRHAAFAMMGR